MTEVQDILQRHKRLKTERGQWEQHWQDLAEVMLPRRADFTVTSVAGERRTNNIYDGTAMLARRGLASAVDGLLKPKTTRWFHMKPQDEDLAEDDEVKRWIDHAEDRLYRAIYNRQARFIQRSGEVDNDLVTFGTGVMFTGESQDRSRLMFRSYHLKNVCIGENADGEVDTVYVTMRLSARQAAQRWGEENLGRKTKEALQQGRNPDERFTFLQAVNPNEQRDARRRDAANLPFASVTVDCESEHVIVRSGFHEFPFAIPRWDTASGETYGRSPAMIALPDTLTSQQMQKTILRAGHRAVDPPLLVGDDAIIGATRTFPGGITVFDMQAARDLGKVPVQPLDTGFRLPIARDMQQDVREQIWSAFFRNVLNLPTDGPEMTAFEVAERKEEFVRTIGPVFGQLESDYLAAVVERSFNIMLRAGAFAPPPEVLRGREVNFEYASPVERVRKQLEALGASQAINLLAPFVQADPAIMDNFDGDQIARDTPEIFGMPQKWTRPLEAVQERREQRQQAMQMASLPEQAKTGADAIKSLAQAGAAGQAGA